MSLKLHIAVLDRAADKAAPFIKRRAAALAKHVKRQGAIDIFLVNDRRMQRLNKQFLNKDRSTNVLSFPTPAGFPAATLGEVYVCPPFIAREGQDLELMLVHGVLHILGYDHHRESDRIKMEKRERVLLNFLRHVR